MQLKALIKNGRKNRWLVYSINIWTMVLTIKPVVTAAMPFNAAFIILISLYYFQYGNNPNIVKNPGKNIKN